MPATSMNNILAYTSHTTTHSGGIPLWALLLIYLGIFLVCYLIPAYFTFRVAKKLSVPDPWMAWIPIIQYYLVWKMTERSQAEVIVALVCGVLSCLAIVTVVFLCIWWAEIAKRMGKSGVVGAFAGLSSLLIGIPFLGVIASGKPDWNYIQAQRAQNVPPGYYYPQPGTISSRGSTHRLDILPRPDITRRSQGSRRLLSRSNRLRRHGRRNSITSLSRQRGAETWIRRPL